MLAFIHVAKTGGQTIETMLESTFGIAHAAAVEWRDRPQSDPFSVDYVVPKYDVEDFNRLKSRCPFLKSVGGHSITLWSGLHEVQPTRYFSMLREPLKRGASHFQYHYHHDQPHLEWEDWINWPVHQNHQVKMFSRHCDPDEAMRDIRRHHVFVGLQDKYDESLVILKKLVAPELNIAYKRTNIARDNTLAKSLLQKPETLEHRKRMYAQEIPLDEWVANEYYPEFVKEYGPTLAADVEAFQKRRGQVNKLNIKLNRAYAKIFIKPGSAGA